MNKRDKKMAVNVAKVLSNPKVANRIAPLVSELSDNDELLDELTKGIFVESAKVIQYSNAIKTKRLTTPIFVTAMVMAIPHVVNFFLTDSGKDGDTNADNVQNPPFSNNAIYKVVSDATLLLSLMSSVSKEELAKQIDEALAANDNKESND